MDLDIYKFVVVVLGLLSSFCIIGILLTYLVDIYCKLFNMGKLFYSFIVHQYQFQRFLDKEQTGYITSEERGFNMGLDRVDYIIRQMKIDINKFPSANDMVKSSVMNNIQDKIKENYK